MVQLNEFQIDCKKRLEKELGQPLENSQVLGRDERYVVGNIPGTEIQVYIYLDGAEVQGNGADLRYEQVDYESEHFLKEAFVCGALSVMKSIRA